MSAEKKKTTPFGKSEGAEPERFIPDGMGMFQRNVKRIGDCALAFLALIVFSPLFLLCYIAVKREDGGPAIFKQERIGRFGRPFNIYKFLIQLRINRQGNFTFKVLVCLRRSYSPAFQNRI